MILLMYTMKRRPSNETKETTGKFVFPSVLRHFRLRHKISGKIKHGKKKMKELQEVVEEKIREAKLSADPESYDKA